MAEPISPIEIQKNNDSNVSIKPICSALNIYRLQTLKPHTHQEIYNLYFEKQLPLTLTPNMEVEKRTTPNDFHYQKQWHLRKIQADLVWQETTGRSPSQDFNPVIVLMDDGFDSFHEDLVDNIWTNPGEIPNDGLDNDNNGYADDYRGLNIETFNDEHFVDQHGTQVAGILGAKGNNDIGIAGVTWDNEILIISNVTNIAEIISALDYSYELKKKFLETDGAEGSNIVVTNFSGGLKRKFPGQYPDWCSMYDLLGTVGILSTGSVANEGFNVEEEGDLPTLCDSPYLITVTNTNEADEKVFDTAYGSTSVDIAAPGESIISSDVNNTYTNISGTSASAPQVAATVGLLYTIACDNIKTLSLMNPPQFALELKEAILNGVDKNETLDETVSKGRLNIYNSMLNLTAVCGEIQRGKLEILPLSPNPVLSSNIGSIEIPYITESSSEHELFVFDRVGQLVFTKKFSPSLFSKKVMTLEGINNLPEGIYFLTVHNDDDCASMKFMVVD